MLFRGGFKHGIGRALLLPRTGIFEIPTGGTSSLCLPGDEENQLFLTLHRNGYDSGTKNGFETLG